MAPTWARVRHIGLLLCAALLSSLTTAYTPLSDETLQNLPSAGADFDIHSGALLAPLLVPRVPGTPGSIAVQRHLVDFFATHLPQWRVEYQNSTSTTPATGNRQVPFVNIIITRDPPWAQPGDVGRLTLVAHYDSKLTPKGFIGATDSAAPCAMLMHAARSVDQALTRKWEAMKAQGLDNGLEEEKGLQILFLDGEEAFLNWNDQDSLYGARSLAETWEQQANPALSIYRTALSSITLFLLLDLLGAANPSIPSYFLHTHWAYKHIAKVEARLRSLKILGSKPQQPFFHEANKLSSNFYGGYIQDDHVPFMARGVEVLHLIPTPFPGVWHQMSDDGEHLDMPTVEDWARIVTAFVGEWMDLEGFFPPLSTAERQKSRAAIRSKTELEEREAHSE